MNKIAFVDIAYLDRIALVGVKIDYEVDGRKYSRTFRQGNVLMDFDGYVKDFTVVDGNIIAWNKSTCKCVQTSNAVVETSSVLDEEPSFIELLYNLVNEECVYIGDLLNPENLVFPTEFSRIKVSPNIVSIYISRLLDDGLFMYDCLVNNNVGPCRFRNFYFGVPKSCTSMFFRLNCKYVGVRSISGMDYMIYSTLDDMVFYSSTLSKSTLEGFVVSYQTDAEFYRQLYNILKYVLRKIAKVIPVEEMGVSRGVETPLDKSTVILSSKRNITSVKTIDAIVKYAVKGIGDINIDELSRTERAMYEMLVSLREEFPNDNVALYKKLYKNSRDLNKQRLLLELKLYEFVTNVYYGNESVKILIDRPEIGNPVEIIRRVDINEI